MASNYYNYFNPIPQEMQSLDKKSLFLGCIQGLGVKDEESDVIAENDTGVAKSCNQRETLVPGHEGDKNKYSAKETPVMVFHALPIDAAVPSGVLQSHCCQLFNV